MTTTIYAIGSKYSYNNLIEWLGCAVDDDQDVDEVAAELIEKVNDSLPGSFLWLPHISEIHAEVGETETLDEDEFNEIVDRCWDELEDELEDEKKFYVFDSLGLQTVAGNCSDFDSLEEAASFANRTFNSMSATDLKKYGDGGYFFIADDYEEEWPLFDYLEAYREGKDTRYNPPE